MKKLDDIPKKNIYQVPEGYFEKLPGVLQARISQESKSTLSTFNLGFVLRYALPAVLIIVAVTLWINRPGMTKDAESILANIETEALISYLAETEITTDEVLDVVTLTDVDIENIEDDVYFNLAVEDEDVILEEINTNAINF